MRIKLPIKKKEKELFAPFLQYMYRTLIPSCCSMVFMLLGFTGHYVLAFLFLIPLLAPLFMDVVFE